MQGETEAKLGSAKHMRMKDVSLYSRETARIHLHIYTSRTGVTRNTGPHTESASVLPDQNRGEEQVRSVCPD